MLELGAPEEIVKVTGNMKFDQMPDSLSPESGSSLSREALGIEAGEILWVAGSTHEHEEVEIIKAYQVILSSHPGLVLLMAPRHIERTFQIEQVIRGFGIPSIRRSRIPALQDRVGHAQGKRIILLDTRGELAGIYRLAVAGFVGGTLVPVGGHNVLEPAQWGKPVLFGPFTDHCQDFAQLLVDQGGGIRVRDGHALADQMKRLLANPEKAEEIGRQAFAAVRQRRGVVHVNLQQIREMVEQCYTSSENQGKSLSGKENSTYTYLLEPDVAFYKARKVVQLFSTYFPFLQGKLTHPEGYFCTSQVVSDFPGRQFRIETSFPYQPKRIRKWCKQNGITHLHVTRRKFPLSIQEIRQQTGIREGGNYFLICTLIEGKKIVFLGSRIGLDS